MTVLIRCTDGSLPIGEANSLLKRVTYYGVTIFLNSQNVCAFQKDQRTDGQTYRLIRHARYFDAC